jgi:hypothetical protein
MNSEKLYTLCDDLQKDFTQTKIIESMSNLEAALQNVVNSPGDSNSQITLSTRQQALYASIDKSIVKDFSPAWVQMLNIIGGTEILGTKLREKIDLIFMRNQITPATALKEIKFLQEELTKFKNGITSVVNGFVALKLESDELGENETEIGFLIPREYVKNDLAELGDEIKEITFILNNLTEFVTGKKETFNIKTISSSDFFISISAETVLWILAFAKAVEWILDQYKKLLEIKSLQSELKEKGIPNENLKGIEAHANSMMEIAVDKIVEEIEKEFPGGKDKQRKNELRNGLKIGFNKLVNRIDKGYNVEIRIKPPKTKDSPDDEKTNKEKLDLYTKVKEVAMKIEFVQLTGESILSLPESKKEMEDKGSKK